MSKSKNISKGCGTEVVDKLIRYASRNDSDIILNGLSALYMFYGLDIIPSEVDFVTSNKNIEETIKAFCNEYNYSYDVEIHPNGTTLYFIKYEFNSILMVEHRGGVSISSNGIQEKDGIKYFNINVICDIFIDRYQPQRDDDKYMLEDIYAGLYVIEHCWDLLDSENKVLVAEGVDRGILGTHLEDKLLDSMLWCDVEKKKLKDSYKSLCDYIKSPAWLELVEQAEEEWGIPERYKCVGRSITDDMTEQEYIITMLIRYVLSKNDNTVLSDESALWYCYGLDRTPSSITFRTSDESLASTVAAVCEEFNFDYEYAYAKKHRDVFYITYGKNKHIKVDIYKEDPDEFANIETTKICNVRVDTPDIAAMNLRYFKCAITGKSISFDKAYVATYIVKHLWNRLSHFTRQWYIKYYQRYVAPWEELNRLGCELSESKETMSKFKSDYMEVRKKFGAEAATTEEETNKAIIMKDFIKYICNKHKSIILDDGSAKCLYGDIDRIPYSIKLVESKRMSDRSKSRLIKSIKDYCDEHNYRFETCGPEQGIYDNLIANFYCLVYAGNSEIEVTCCNKLLDDRNILTTPDGVRYLESRSVEYDSILNILGEPWATVKTPSLKDIQSCVYAVNEARSITYLEVSNIAHFLNKYVSIEYIEQLLSANTEGIVDGDKLKADYLKARDKVNDLCKAENTESDIERSSVIKDLVQFINRESSHFILDSYAALHLCYGSDRVPSVVEFVSDVHGCSVKKQAIRFCKQRSYQWIHMEGDDNKHNVKIVYNDKGDSIRVTVKERTDIWFVKETTINNIKVNSILSLAHQFAIYKSSFFNDMSSKVFLERRKYKYNWCESDYDIYEFENTLYSYVHKTHDYGEDFEHLYAMYFIAKKHYRRFDDGLIMMYSDQLNSYTANNFREIKTLFQIKNNCGINEPLFLMTLQKLCWRLKSREMKVRKKLENIK